MPEAGSSANVMVGVFCKALKHKVIDGPGEGHMETWIDGITYELDKPRPGTFYLTR